MNRDSEAFPSTSSLLLEDSVRPPVIICQQLRKRFDQKEVLRGVDLTIPTGAIVGLVGTNGSGKSTLIKCLLGLLRPTSGQATVFGEDPWDLSAQSKARLGYSIS